MIEGGDQIFVSKLVSDGATENGLSVSGCVTGDTPTTTRFIPAVRGISWVSRQCGYIKA